MFRLVLLVALAAPLLAHAQAYPSKPVRIVNPFAPGGATDIIARHMAQKLSEVGGQVSLMFDNLPTALPHVKSGKLRTLAVSTAARSALAPGLPTMAEAGLPGFDLATWFAFFAPAATPRELTGRISNDMRRALAQPDTKERLSGIGVDIRASSADELAQFQRAELAKWAKIVKDSGAKLD